MTRVGRIRHIVRYPIKSMTGVPTESAVLGWHGLDGDRRYAFRRADNRSEFPWLSASRLPELLLYRPLGLVTNHAEPHPAHVRLPTGAEVERHSAALESDVAKRLGSGVELMKLKHGIFDEAVISIISTETVATIALDAEIDKDHRRFRPNIVLDTGSESPFPEDEWVDGTLKFGNREPRPAVSVTCWDERCMMINLDPDTACHDARVLKSVVRLNQNNAGVYATVIRTGSIHVGDEVVFEPARP